MTSGLANMLMNSSIVTHPMRQGLTLVHFSVRREHFLWDTLGA